MRYRLFDCFTFFDELDVLELRLSELAKHVHRFVLVEATRTFSGRPKPLYFLENKSRFRPYLDKIEHVVLQDSDFPQDTVSAWDREYISRTAMLRGLDKARPDDFILVSDVDEIPFPLNLTNVMASPRASKQITVFESLCYIYFFNLKASGRKPSVVQAPRLIQRKYLRDPQVLRGFKPRVSKQHKLGIVEAGVLRLRAFSKFGYPLRVSVQPCSSWHFTYSGSPEQIRAKILAYSHTEKATPNFVAPDVIENAVASRTYIFNPEEVFEEVPINEALPKSLQNDPTRWKDRLTSSVGQTS
jgi:beta-1,4-mannosyl-glycoprotein beta-1,4-N-acetylglucosaminyltransferase